MKSMCKKLLSITLCFLLLFGAVSVGGESFLQAFEFLTVKASAENETSGTCGENLTWIYDESTQTLTISGTGNMKTFSAGSYDGQNVTKAPWRPYYNTMKNAVIENGVTNIGWNAFKGCKGLTSITIPDTVTSIGTWSFEDCAGLTNITIPDSVTSISDFAFSGCSALSSIIVPDSVVNLGTYVFKNCTGLTSATISNEVTDIGYGLFYNCTGLSSIAIPEDVTSIGMQTFQNCTALTSITIPDGVTTIGDHAFNGCSGLTSIFIPESVTGIGTYVLRGCSGLESITVDENNSYYHSVGNCLINTNRKILIAGCKNSVIPDDGTVTSIGDSAFYDCKGLVNITIPESVESIGKYAFYHCKGLVNITISEGVESIGFDAFDGCTGLTSVIIPDSVTKIEGYAFAYCTGLLSLTVPDSVSVIGNGAFDNVLNVVYYGNASGSPWGAITMNKFADGCLIYESENKQYLICCHNGVQGEVVLPDSVLGIGDCAFNRCTGMTSITIPDSVIMIGSEAFYGCTGLTSIDIPDSITSIDEGVFARCTGLTSIAIPDGVTDIGISAFNNCNGLTSITIPDSVTNIDSYAFCGCFSLSSLTIPDSVTNIGNYAFAMCTGLTNITIPAGITEIKENVFSGCTELENIIIPDGVTSIGKQAFSYCTGLTSITIPDSVTEIKDDAFYISIDDDELNGAQSEYDILMATDTTSMDLFEMAEYNFFVEFYGSILRDPISSLTEVNYTGKEENWNEIIISEGNEDLLSATIHFLGDEPVHVHDYVEEISKEPTCEEKGIKTFTCFCGDSYTETIEKLPHTPKTVTIDPTCTETGLEYSICAVCNEKLSEDTIIPAKGHSYDEGVVTDPTCTESGYTTYTCDCGDSYTYSEVPALGHSFTNYVYNNDATIDSDGTETAKCDRCDETDTRIKPSTRILPTEAVIKAVSSATVDYKANVTVTATATGVPEGYVLAIYEGNALREKGSNISVSYKAGTMTANRTFTVKVIDNTGKVQKDGSGNDLAANCEVKVKTGFFDKLIAFFKGLFGSLPNVEVKP